MKRIAKPPSAGIALGSESIEPRAIGQRHRRRLRAHKRRLAGFRARSSAGVIEQPMGAATYRAHHAEQPTDEVISSTVLRDHDLPMPTASALALAQKRWQEARERGEQGYAQVLEALGPHLTPKEVALRLGVSGTTVNNRRNQGKLLALRRDEHQYIYPVWQFAEPSQESELGLVPHLIEVLRALGEVSSWEKVRFLRSRRDEIGSLSSIEVLHRGHAEDLAAVLSAARMHGHMGR